MKSETQKTRKPRASKPRITVPLVLNGRFASIDFETASYARNSACSVSLSIVENNILVDQFTTLVRPPQPDFQFTYIHGITWNHVKNQPTFGEIWPEIAKRITGLDILAAHNASFDRSVLKACCELAGVTPVTTPFLCTVKLARAIWEINPTTLSAVAGHLSIPLMHHDAESDAHACAQIMIKAVDQGHAYEDLVHKFMMKPSRA